MSAMAEERVVRLLDEDADLAERVPPVRRALARAELLARMTVLPPGTAIERVLPHRDQLVHGLLLLDGLVSRTTVLADTATVQLLGATDLMDARGAAPGAAGLVPVTVRSTVLETTRVVLLDDALVQRAQSWPEVLATFFDRATSQSQRLGTQCAISSLTRVEDRVETLLWFLAERWGRIGRDGVVLPMRLTHEALGQMLGAKRPTVSLALKQLAAEGLVERRPDGAWLLRRRWAEAPVAIEAAGGGTRLIAPFHDVDAPARPRSQHAPDPGRSRTRRAA